MENKNRINNQELIYRRYFDIFAKSLNIEKPLTEQEILNNLSKREMTKPLFEQKYLQGLLELNLIYIINKKEYGDLIDSLKRLDVNIHKAKTRYFIFTPKTSKVRIFLLNFVETFQKYLSSKEEIINMINNLLNAMREYEVLCKLNNSIITKKQKLEFRSFLDEKKYLNATEYKKMLVFHGVFFAMIYNFLNSLGWRGVYFGYKEAKSLKETICHYRSSLLKLFGEKVDLVPLLDLEVTKQDIFDDYLEKILDKVPKASRVKEHEKYLCCKRNNSGIEKITPSDYKEANKCVWFLYSYKKKYGEKRFQDVLDSIIGMDARIEIVEKSLKKKVKPRGFEIGFH